MSGIKIAGLSLELYELLFEEENMSRYIDADALLKELHKAKEENEKARMVLIDCDFETLIRDAPTVDVEPVRHGKWLTTDAYPHKVYCSECYKTYAQTNWQVWTDEEYPLPRNYCPNCGAKMDKE